MKRKKYRIVVALFVVVALSLSSVYSLSAQAANPVIPAENMELCM